MGERWSVDDVLSVATHLARIADAVEGLETAVWVLVWVGVVVGLNRILFERGE